MNLSLQFYLLYQILLTYQQNKIQIREEAVGERIA